MLFDVLPKMTLLRIALILLSACVSCLAQVEFGFYVADDVKDEKLDYTFVQNVTVRYEVSDDSRLMYSKDDDYRLMYHTEYRISGINQKEFTFTTERFVGIIPRKEFVEWRTRARKLPTKDLKIAGKGHASGFVTVDGEDHDVSASVDSEPRKLWKAFIDDLLTKYAPEEKRIKSTRTIQGEAVDPVVVSFPELLKNPKLFDGKRIRIGGFYHGGFECSSFAAKPNDIRNFKRALWLGGVSSFADRTKVRLPNDATLSIDGTFDLCPAGHLRAWMGELSRVTAISKRENKP